MFFRVITLLILMILSPIYVSASEPATPWEVEMVYPENQNTEEENFFDLQAEPGDLLSLDVRISNNRSEPLEIQVKKANAYTAPEGGIVYEEELAADAALLEEDARLAEFMEVDKALTIPAGESEKLHIHVNVPESAEGTLLGGIKLTRADSASKNSSEAVNEKGTNFFSDNEQEKSIAIKIDLPDAAGAANFSIGKIAFDSLNSQVTMEMINATKEIQGNVQGTYTLMDLSGNELLSGVIDSFVMAPRSKIEFPIALGFEQLEDGTYTLMAKGKAGEKEFFAEETFPVSKGTGKVESESSSPEPVIAISGKIALWALLSGGVILAIVLFVLGSRGKNIKLARRANS